MTGPGPDGDDVVQPPPTPGGDGAPASGEQVWRPSVGMRVVFVALAVVSIAFGVACAVVAAGEDALVAGIVVGVLFVAVGVGIVQIARMTVTLDDTGVDIRNFGGVDHVPWERIRRASAGTAGVTLVLGDDDFEERRPKVAMAVQRPRSARLLKKETQADRLAAAIEERVRLRREDRGRLPPDST